MGWLDGCGGGRGSRGACTGSGFHHGAWASRFEPVDRNPDFDGRTIINRAGFWRMAGGEREHLTMPEAWRSEV